MTRPRVMFVDDEPHILEGLRNRLRRMRDTWDLAFVDEGAQALLDMDRQPVDVLVTDMRMPRMDGAALLAEVKARHPEVVRIVLSGHSELERTRRSIPAAHQFLAKPCEDRTLETVITRALALKALIGDDAVRAVVGKIESLPAMPSTYARVRATLADENAGAGDVAAVLRLDPAICARLLQLVNSAFFGLSRDINRVDDAIAYLGLERTAAIVLASEVFALAPAVAGFSVDELQRHSLATASAVLELLPAGKDRDDAYMAALLHDVGKLVFALYVPEHLARASEEAERGGEPLNVAESRLFRATHAEVGAYLLGLWGLPYSIVEAVAHHHAFERAAETRFGVTTAVHVADALDRALRGEPFARPDDDALVALGVPAGSWDRWLEARRRAAEQGP